MTALVVGIVRANPPKTFDDEWEDEEAVLPFEEEKYFFNKD